MLLHQNNITDLSQSRLQSHVQPPGYVNIADLNVALSSVIICLSALKGVDRQVQMI